MPPNPDDLAFRLLRALGLPAAVLAIVIAGAWLLAWLSALRTATRTVKVVSREAAAGAVAVRAAWRQRPHSIVRGLGWVLAFVAQLLVIYCCYLIDGIVAVVLSSGDERMPTNLARAADQAISTTAIVIGTEPVGPALRLPWWAAAHVALCVIVLFRLNRGSRSDEPWIGGCAILLAPMSFLLFALACVFVPIYLVIFLFGFVFIQGDMVDIVRDNYSNPDQSALALAMLICVVHFLGAFWACKVARRYV